MRAFVTLSAISLVAAASAPAAANQRVASLNLCTDELVLALADDAQLVSLSHLSHDPAEAPWWRRARQVAANDGSLIGAITARPTLVVTMGGGASAQAGVARRLGVRLLDLPFPAGIADVARNLRRLGTAIGRPDRAALIVAQLRALVRSRPSWSLDAILTGSGARTAAPGGLEAQWMALVGLRQRSLPGDRIEREALVLRPPQVFLVSSYRATQYSNARRWSQALAARSITSRRLVTDGRRWTCFGPSLIPEIVRLRSQLQR